METEYRRVQVEKKDKAERQGERERVREAGGRGGKRRWGRDRWEGIERKREANTQTHTKNE